MGPTSYALCQKSVIGPAMWIAGLCAFPPLIGSTHLSLNVAGSEVAKAFTVPVDKSYQFVLQFEFATSEARLSDTIVGSSYRAECDEAPALLADKPEFGRPIPIRILVRRAKDRSIVIDREFTSLCLLGFAETQKTRRIGSVELVRGDYIAELINLTAQVGLADIKTSFALIPAMSK